MSELGDVAGDDPLGRASARLYAVGLGLGERRRALRLLGALLDMAGPGGRLPSDLQTLAALVGEHGIPADDLDSYLGWLEDVAAVERGAHGWVVLGHQHHRRSPVSTVEALDIIASVLDRERLRDRSEEGELAELASKPQQPYQEVSSPPDPMPVGSAQPARPERPERDEATRRSRRAPSPSRPARGTPRSVPDSPPRLEATRKGQRSRGRVHARVRGRSLAGLGMAAAVVWLVVLVALPGSGPSFRGVFQGVSSETDQTSPPKTTTVTVPPSTPPGSAAMKTRPSTTSSTKPSQPLRTSSTAAGRDARCPIAIPVLAVKTVKVVEDPLKTVIGNDVILRSGPVSVTGIITNPSTAPAIVQPFNVTVTRGTNTVTVPVFASALPVAPGTSVPWTVVADLGQSVTTDAPTATAAPLTWAWADPALAAICNPR